MTVFHAAASQTTVWWLSFQVLENFMAGVEEVIGHKGTHYWTVLSKRVSRRFLRPLLHRHPHKKGTRLVATYQEVEIQYVEQIFHLKG